MARIFITGSADGLGRLAAGQLVEEGHRVVLHARNARRGDYALGKVTGAEQVLTAERKPVIQGCRTGSLTGLRRSREYGSPGKKTGFP